jgi:hypothetical protein
VTSKQQDPVPTAGASPANFAVIRVSVAIALAFLAGFVAFLLLAWSDAGTPGLAEYLSEMGATGAPGAGPYRLAVICVAVAAALVALAWRLRAPGVGAAAYLALGSAMFVVSAAVPCASGCPIPIRDGVSTLPNFVHFSVSGLAFALAIGAMLMVSAADVEPRLRRISSAAARTAMVLYGILAALMLVFGRGLANGLVERSLAVVCLAWVAWAAVRICHRPVTEVPQS